MKSFLLIICFTLTFNIVYADANNDNATNDTETQQTANQTTVELSPYEKSLDQKLQAILQTLSPDEKTALAKKAALQEKLVDNPTSLILYKPTYVLPFYYTEMPYQSVYDGQTPDNQKIMHSEFKFQISFQMPVFHNIFNPHDDFSFAYTQDSFWQVYAKSQYFRETNYEPEFFYHSLVTPQFSWQAGIVHQSNGRGGTFERSWNRVYGEMFYSGKNWLVDLKTWLLILKRETSNKHNPNIVDYMGNGDTVLAYKLGSNTISLMLRNNLESKFQRGAEQLTFSFPLQHHFRGFVFIFSGYGQSLIEYDNYTNAFGLGVTLNDWI